MRTERLHHLDLLRGSMMSLGVLVHATHADYDLGRYEWIRFLSGSFRMACFFLISGYFSLMSLERHGHRRFLGRRAAALGIPAAFSVLLLNPPAIAWMREYFATAPVPVTPVVNWHGPMWFLFVLLAYTFATRGIVRALEAARRRLERACAPGVADALVIAAVTAGSALAGKLLEEVSPILPGFGAWAWIAHATTTYLPYFALGLMAYRFRSAFALVHSRPWAWGALAAAALAARYLVDRGPITNAVEHVVHVAVDYAAGFSCSLALVSAANRLVRRGSRLVSFAGESAYTLYVVHYVFIAFALVHAQRLGLPVPLRAACAALLAAGCGVGIHALLVRRVALAALLLNGRLPPRRDALEPGPGPAAGP